MNIEELEISLGLPEHLLPEAAKLWYEAFRHDIESLLGCEATSLAILQKSFKPEQALIALYQSQLVGVVGLQYEDRTFLQFRLTEFINELGWLKGTLNFFLTRLSGHKIQKGEVFIEAIAVEKSMQGQGLGTLMLGEVAEFARQNQFKVVGLNVFENNPDARRLYDRLGFVAVKTRNYAFLRRVVGSRFIGSASVTTMHLNL